MRNVFMELGITQEEIKSRIQSTFQTIFFDSTEKIYLDVGGDMACMVDTGNNDARTEGMSYGMMMAVQMDRQERLVP